MRRPTLQILLALLLAGVVTAPVAAADPSGAGPVVTLEGTPGAGVRDTLSGVLQAYYVDDPGSEHAPLRYDLRTSDGVVRLDFPGVGPRRLVGARVTVTGTRAGGALHVATSKPGRDLRVDHRAPRDADGAWAAFDGTGGGTSAAANVQLTGGDAVVAKSFAVVLINFKDLATRPWSKSTVADAVTGGATSMKAFFEEESKGRMSVSASVFGWYTIDATTSGCDWRTWHTLGANAAAAAGVDLGAFTNVIFAWPQTNQCGFAGVAYVPGRYSYLNGTISVQVMTHEVGHNFGLGHANARNCVVNGTRVTIAAAGSCTTSDYADPFSTMGNNALRHNHGSQLGELGWLAASEKVVGWPGNTYTVSPYLGSGPVKLVRIPRGDGSFFDLDVRTPYGSFDNFSSSSPAVNGVTIRIGYGTASPTTSPKATELLDATPGTTDLKDAPLLVGKTIKDPVSTISFTTLSVDSSGVTVRVREGIDPSAPASFAAIADERPSVGLSWDAATDNVAVGGYRVTRDGALAATLPATAGSWTDGGVVTGTTHVYGVAAVDTSGNVGPAATTTVTVPGVLPPDAGAPTPPEPFTGSPTTTTVSLAWGAATDDIGVTGYRITRNGTLVTTVAGWSTGWKDTSRAPRTTYAYTVTALDAAGNSSEANALNVTTRADTTRPSAPRRFHVTSRSGTHVRFAWSRSSDNVGVVKYKIYREGRKRAVGVTTGTSIRIHARYRARYFVRAFDAAGNRSYASRHVRGR